MEPTPSTMNRTADHIGESRKYADQNPYATRAATGCPLLRGITTASAYWHSLATLARWCRIRSYLDSAIAHGITAIDAIRTALEGKPWLPPPPATA
jgi:hypothetical protein